MGSYHIEYGINNQDSGFEYKNVNCVIDGCSEGKHSEVGAILFAKKLQELVINLESLNNLNIRVDLSDIIKIYEKIKNVITRCSPTILSLNYNDYLRDMINYMCFTILYLEELKDAWILHICGDGYIILEDKNEIITFHEIDHSETPMYLAYSYIDKEHVGLLENAKLGFKTYKFSKSEYKALGIASDGLRFVVGSEYEDNFKDLIKNRKKFVIMRKINQINNQHKNVGGFFKDDLTISMR